MMGEIPDEIQRVALQIDQEDLLAVLSMRFGAVPEDIQTRIATATELDTLERLILVAANVPDWESFMEELDAGSRAFRLVGQRYDPLAGSTTPRASSPSGAPGSGDDSQ
jgi:hypothetical protein